MKSTHSPATLQLFREISTQRYVCIRFPTPEATRQTNRMNTTPTSAIYNLIVLDESGSMKPVKAPTITGFNEIVQTISGTQQQFPDQPQFVTLVTFNGLGIKTLLDKQPVDQLTPLTNDQYRPDASTPLLDALGRSLLRLEAQIDQEQNPTVLVSILTDGDENASREFSGPAVRAIVERLQGRGWTFTYMGTNHAVEQTAASISIKTSVRFDHNESGLKDLFERERKGRTTYYEKKRQGMSSADAEQGYYDQP